MKLLLKSAVIAFSAIGIVLSLHTISYAADSSTANIANAPDITSGNSATTDNDTAHNIGITVSVNNNGSVSDYTKNLTDGSYDTTINLVPNATVNVKADENMGFTSYGAVKSLIIRLLITARLLSVEKMDFFTTIWISKTEAVILQ